MRALAGGIPRAFKSHKSPEGHAYRLHVTAIVRRLGDLPADARPTLREVGRLSVELAALGFELEQARARKRRREVSRLRRAMVPMRTQMLTLERRLEELASGRNGQGDPLAAVRTAVARANRR